MIGTVIHPLVYEVDRHARHLDPGTQRLTNCIHPGKCGQERRVDVEDSVGKAGNRLGAEDPHEPSQYQSLDPRRFGDIANLLGELGPVTAVGNHRRLDRGSPSTLERPAILDIADHEPETCKPVVDQGLEIGTGAAGKNCEFDCRLL